MGKRLRLKIKAQVAMAGLFLLFSQPAFAQTLYEAKVGLGSPEEISRWFSSQFRYETEMPDYWQSAEETVKLKKGDCEDFAILAQELLANLNIESQVIIVKFKGLSLMHALCVFKENGVYKMFSNDKLIKTDSDSLTGAIEKVYPDWESITFTNAAKDTLKVVARGNSHPAKGRLITAAEK